MTQHVISDGSPDVEPTDLPHRHIAVVVSRFPKFTETFVVNEILGLLRLGWQVEILPLLSPEPEPHQPNATPLVQRARFGRLLDRRAVTAFLRAAVTRPTVLWGIVATLVRETWTRPSFLVKDLVLLPRITAIAEEVQRIGVSHVHAHFATHAGFAAWALGRLTGLPYSVVAHGSDIHRHQAMLGTKVSEAAFVATVSAFNRDVITSACGAGVASRVVVVRGGTDLTMVDTGRARQPARDAPPSVLCVGTLHEVKGQAWLLRALAELRRAGHDITVELVGDGPDRPELEALARTLDVDDRVRFLGAVAHDQVIARYREATVLVVPSIESRDGRKEGMPTVIVEAMAAGVPVVASDLAGISELVRHEETGLLVRPGDATAIAAAIERLRDEPALAVRLRTAARAAVEVEYDQRHTIAQMARLIVGVPS